MVAWVKVKGNYIRQIIVNLLPQPFICARRQGEAILTLPSMCFYYLIFLDFCSEQKRRLKAEQKAKEKAEKAPAPVEGSKKTKDALNDEDINPNEYFKLRSLAVQQLKSTKISPYPHKYHVDTSLQEYIEKFTYLTNGQALEDQTFSVAG